MYPPNLHSPVSEQHESQRPCVPRRSPIILARWWACANPYFSPLPRKMKWAPHNAGQKTLAVKLLEHPAPTGLRFGCFACCECLARRVPGVSWVARPYWRFLSRENLASGTSSGSPSQLCRSEQRPNEPARLKAVCSYACEDSGPISNNPIWE